jgi:predicted N-acyltransferase
MVIGYIKQTIMDHTSSRHYRMHIVSSLDEIGQNRWDALVGSQPGRTPFLSYAFLQALHDSGSACAKTG